MTLSIITFGITTLSIMTFSIMTFSIMTLSIIGLFATLSINDTLSIDTKHNTIYCHNAECHDFILVC